MFNLRMQAGKRLVISEDKLELLLLVNPLFGLVSFHDITLYLSDPQNPIRIRMTDLNV